MELWVIFPGGIDAWGALLPGSSRHVLR